MCDVKTVKPIEWSGVFAPVPTTFDMNGAIDMQNFTKNIQTLNKHELTGYIVCGSNGEFPYLKHEERVQLVQMAKKAITPGRLLIGGAGSEGTWVTTEMCNMMADAGADAVIVHTPHYFSNRMTPEALYTHYKTIADKCRVPLIMYNTPMHTGIDMDNNTIARLAAHSKIFGILDNTGNLRKMEELVKMTKTQQFKVMDASQNMVDMMAVGCSGTACALTNVMPTEMSRVRTMMVEGKTEEAKKIQTKLSNAMMMVTVKYGVPALKHMMDRCGMYGGPTRLPMLPLTEEEKVMVETEFKNCCPTKMC